MSDFEKQIQQIKNIRALRVRSRLREQAVSGQTFQLAEHAIVKAQQKVSREEHEAITFQRDGLSKLLGGNLVNVDRLMDFNKQKLKSIKRVADAKMDVLETIGEKTKAAEHLASCILATKQAEKRLIGIEEVIAKQLWK